MFLFCYSSDGETVEVDAELVIGADGAHSAIRNEMMKKPRYLQVKLPQFSYVKKGLILGVPEADSCVGRKTKCLSLQRLTKQTPGILFLINPTSSKTH